MPLRTTRIGQLWWVKVPTCVAECGGTVSYAPDIAGENSLAQLKNEIACIWIIYEIQLH
jgi:hypothetical protein